MMEETSVEEEQQQPKEQMVTRSSLIIVAAFLVLQIGILTWVFRDKIFSGGNGETEASAVSELEKIALVSLGRFEITKPNDPLQNSFTRCSVTIDLQVPIERAQEVDTMVSKLTSLFRETARQAFLDADSRDLASENLASVKNAIRTGINQKLGEDIVEDVVFGDFRTY